MAKALCEILGTIFSVPVLLEWEDADRADTYEVQVTPIIHNGYNFNNSVIDERV